MGDRVVWAAANEIREYLGLSAEECRLDYDSIIIESQDVMGEIIIEKNISNILYQYNNIKFNFRKCIFKQPIILKEITFEKGIYCANSIFEDLVEFTNIDFRDGIDFVGSTFKKEADFYDSNLEKACFSNTIFSDNAYFEKTKFATNIDFSSILFEGEVLFSGSIFKQYVSFNRTIFHGKTNFSNTSFYDEARFEYTIFKMEAVFSDSIFSKSISFERAVFDDYARFNSLIDSAESSQENSNYVANFLNAKFKKDADFFNSTFHQQAKFSGTIFDDYATFNSAKFLSEANFMGTHFKGGASFTSSVFEQDACFSCVTFHDDVSFDQAKFQTEANCQGNADFSEAHFKGLAEFNSTFGHNAIFHRAIFSDNAYFEGAIFQEMVNFDSCHFYQNTYFYGAIFQSISQYKTLQDFPFYQTTFHDGVYLSTDLFDFNFKHLKTIIEQDKGVERSESKINKLRQMFRNIKSSFIEIHNYLDAAHYHKMELYVKELELEYKKKEEPQNSTTRDFVDRIQFMFYRMTSDHHTDLLLILNNVLALIVLFGGFAYGLCCFASYATKWVDCECCTSAEVYYLYSLTTDSFCIDCNIWNVFCIETFLIISLCCVFVAAFILLMLFFNYVNTICRELGYWFIAFFVLNLFILAIKPALILPIFGKLIDESLKIDFPAFTSLSIVYAILMFLLIFSLQKTARKNTIVPS